MSLSNHLEFVWSQIIAWYWQTYPTEQYHIWGHWTITYKNIQFFGNCQNQPSDTSQSTLIIVQLLGDADYGVEDDTTNVNITTLESVGSKPKSQETPVLEAVPIPLLMLASVAPILDPFAEAWAGWEAFLTCSKHGRWHTWRDVRQSIWRSMWKPYPSGGYDRCHEASTEGDAKIWVVIEKPNRTKEYGSSGLRREWEIQCQWQSIWMIQR